ncbi:MAG TPA: zinc-dependent metalloprotease [Saprospiraceae bacterium]|nr:zinc-dependent metalloprotease [Saprospiraceae bacterium]HNT19889.1 zinc-dependent metalloprotease [Saprospiraceae bacterium]
MKNLFFSLWIALIGSTSLPAQEIRDFPGYFPFTYSEKDGRVTLSVSQVGEEFLYVQGLSSGVGSNDLGLDRGQIGRERIVKFKRAANKLLLVQPNYSYRAISNNEAERKSVEEAFAQSVLWGFPIEREENGILYIDLTPFLMQDAHDVSGRLESARQGTYRLDLGRSALNLDRTRNFPKNTEWDVLLTFTGKATGQYIRSVTPSPEAVSVHQHHSFVELPDDGYQPRTFDPRSGFFETSFYNYATPISEPLKKMLTVRHRLEKKDPFAPFSEPVKPIIYYVDAGCPEPIKSALIEGASWWNEAFETAGFINAFQVREMPADADPMDVRYNVIQWVHRSTRGWSYGNTVTDPRTGEIIKGHVSLGSLRVRQDYLIARGLASPFGHGDENTGELTAMALARLRQLSAHEVGHTLGLSHNYASTFNGRASVMDYPHPVVDFKDGKPDFSNAYDVGIGAWDKRAILWGYSDFPQGTDELKALDQIMNETIRLNLKYLTDQDSRPAGSAHPYSHLWDNGQSAVDELQRILQVRRQALQQFGLNTLRTGEPMATLENVLVPLYLSHRYQVEAVSKWIGGMEYNYAVKGDSQLITRVVPSSQQALALNAVLKSISPSELSLPENILNLIPPQPPGYDRDRENFKTYTGLPFDPLAAAESISGFALGFLVQPERLARIVEQNARNASHWNLLSYLQNIHRGISSHPVTNGLEQEIKLNNERIFINKLLSVMADKNLASSVMSPCLRFIKLTESQLSSSQSSQAGYIMEMIRRYREDPSSFEAPEPSRMPDGAPIGCFQE